MRNLILSLCLVLSVKAFPKQSDTNLVDFNNHKFYFIKEEGNSKLIIFLHGGVTNPIFGNKNKPDLKYLLERNSEFVAQCVANGFNLLVPIKDDSLNWLTHHNYCYQVFESFVKEKIGSHLSVFISGFSDGGTGSYRIFYEHPYSYEGLVVFNGYPQLQNFDKKVNYTTIKNKKIVFFSTMGDKVIPYEFLLAEYYKQKKINPCTYFYIAAGDHTFENYKKAEIDILFDILNSKNINYNTEAIHGFIKNDSLIRFYNFRKEIVRKFGFGQEEYDMNKKQKKNHTN